MLVHDAERYIMKLKVIIHEAEEGGLLGRGAGYTWLHDPGTEHARVNRKLV